ncbi:hypothetical protein PoB_000911800 [Plakobranchus ocellatus]|uniref:Uncharacterized protein n=1 Tax=Plakobranchus ocellatus TaxID=259542 RepID=A0AAV3YK71_9GAST|nr:hypothetical protein PoB_000911800 [Plakobranchus ocellatus]
MIISTLSAVSLRTNAGVSKRMLGGIPVLSGFPITSASSVSVTTAETERCKTPAIATGDRVSAFDCSRLCSLKTAIGPRTVLPNNNSNGAKPIDSCGASLYANRAAGRYRSQSRGRSAVSFFDDGLYSPIKALNKSVRLWAIRGGCELLD